MFVGGVPPDCNEEQFSDFFGQFGRVVDATLMMDKDTGRPRGFGFVTFDTGEAVEKAMQTPFLQINNKTIEVKRATPKGNQERAGAGRGAATYNPNGGFGEQPNPAAAYGGMTPAMMAQYYQRMQQWMAQMQAMGRGQMAQGMMGMNPMMNPMMQQQFQQQQQQQQQAPQQQQQQPQQQQQQQYDDAQYDDEDKGVEGAPTGPRDSAPLDAPSGPSRDNRRPDRGSYRRGGGQQQQFDRAPPRGPRGGRGGYRGNGRFDPYSR